MAGSYGGWVPTGSNPVGSQGSYGYTTPPNYTGQNNQNTSGGGGGASIPAAPVPPIINPFDKTGANNIGYINSSNKMLDELRKARVASIYK